VANNGVAADWTYLGAFPEVNADGNWELYNSTDPSKELKFDLSGLPTGTTRTVSGPLGNGRMLVESQPIGSTTPAAGTFTSLVSRNLTGDPELLTLFSQYGSTKFYGTHFTIPNINLLDSTDLYLVRGGGKVAVGPYTAPPTSTLQVNGNIAANNGTLTASAPVLDLAQTWNASGTTFTGLNLALTNTASASASAYLSFALDGTQAFSIRRGESTIPATLITCGGSGLTWTARTRTGAGVGVNFSGIVGIGTNIQFGTGSSTTGGDVVLTRDDAANTLALRNAANAQTFNIYNTHTSATNHERLRLAWASNVAIIGTEKGSGGGTARDLVFQTDGTTRMTIAGTSNAITCTGSLSIVTNLTFQGNSSIVGNVSSGVIRLLNAAQNGFDRLQFGGSTTSFPALKRDSTALQARLANDSDFCPLQGQLRIHQNAVSETITATHTLTLFDAAGTAYKVPCVAA
jgi:hypothetical protein